MRRNGTNIRVPHIEYAGALTNHAAYRGSTVWAVPAERASRTAMVPRLQKCGSVVASGTTRHRDGPTVPLRRTGSVNSSKQCPNNVNNVSTMLNSTEQYYICLTLYMHGRSRMPSPRDCQSRVFRSRKTLVLYFHHVRCAYLCKFFVCRKLLKEICIFTIFFCWPARASERNHAPYRGFRWAASARLVCGR